MGKIFQPYRAKLGQQIVEVKVICNARGFMTDITFDPPMPGHGNIVELTAYQKLAMIVATRIKQALKPHALNPVTGSTAEPRRRDGGNGVPAAEKPPRVPASFRSGEAYGEDYWASLGVYRPGHAVSGEEHQGSQGIASQERGSTRATTETDETP